MKTPIDKDETEEQEDHWTPRQEDHWTPRELFSFSSTEEAKAFSEQVHKRVKSRIEEMKRSLKSDDNRDKEN